MTQNELIDLATTVCLRILDENKDLVRKRIMETFSASDDKSPISLEDAMMRSTALALTLAPELSARVTAQLLIDLGIIQVDNCDRY